MPTHRRSVWCEMLPYDELASPALLAALATRGVELLLAVRPPDLDALPDALAACRQAGVRVGLWVMIDDAAGRWASVSTMGAYCDFVDLVLSTQLSALAAGAQPLCAEFVFDLEPPIGAVRAALDDHGPRALAAGLLHRLEELRHPENGTRPVAPGSPPPAATVAAAARHRLATTLGRLASLGVEASAAIVPILLADGPGARLASLLKTPVAGLPWARQHAMMYTSLVEGYAPRLASRADCLSLLDLGCRRAAALLGPRAAVSVGVVGPGALGDERPYASVDELRKDVAVARAAAIEDIALFDLGGVVHRAPIEPWLDALVATPPAARRPPLTAPALAAAAMLRAAALSLELISSRNHQ